MSNTLVNRDFDRAVKQMRRILPRLSFSLLIGTYLISALIMGIFHSAHAPNIGFTVAAFLVPLAIQAGRGTLVFFFQLNPARIQSRFSMGIVAATALLLLSLWEAYLVMIPYGMSWTVSVSTLMLIGWVIELMILKETMFATQMELYQNKEQWQELKDFYVAKAEFEEFMDDLYEGKRPSVPSPEEPKAEEGGVNPPTPASPLPLELPQDNNHAQGNGFSPSLMNGLTL